MRPGIDAVDYNEYAWKQCQDLIQRHKPYFLWGDVSWPEAYVRSGLVLVLADFQWGGPRPVQRGETTGFALRR